MAVEQAHVTVTDSATLLSTATSEGTGQPSSHHTVILQNPSTTVTVWIGNASVTTTNGVQLAPGAHLEWDLERGEKLYGRVASGTQVVYVGRGSVES